MWQYPYEGDILMGVTPFRKQSHLVFFIYPAKNALNMNLRITYFKKKYHSI